MSNLIGKIQGTVKEGKSCIKLNSDIVDINGLEITSDGIFGGFTKGMVVQVQHKDYKKSVKKDSTGWTAIDNNLETGFVVAIKPSSSASNVLVSCNLHIGINQSIDGRWWGARLYRKIGNGDWTHVSEATGEETNGTPIWLTDSSHENDDNMRFRLINLGNSFLDSPNTTETVYYTIYWKCRLGENSNNGNGNDPIYLNRSYQDNENYTALPISNITAKEIWNSGTVYRPDNNLITLDQSDNNVDISGTLNVQGEKVMTVPALDICGNDLSANTTYEITTGPTGNINNISFVKKQPEYILSAYKSDDQSLTGNGSNQEVHGFQVGVQKNTGFNVGDELAPGGGNSAPFVWQCPANGLYHIIFEAVLFQMNSNINFERVRLQIREQKTSDTSPQTVRTKDWWTHSGGNDNPRHISNDQQQPPGKQDEEQEQAEESVPVDYAGDALEVGFNVSYLLDVMGVLTGATVRMSLSDSASSALIEEGEAGGDTDAEALYVVMPMRL